jgi:hypothetical protein
MAWVNTFGFVNSLKKAIRIFILWLIGTILLIGLLLILTVGLVMFGGLVLLGRGYSVLNQKKAYV